MEVLSHRMAPALKGEDSWKHKRVYDDKHVRQSEVKLEHRPERVVNYEAMRESGHKRLHAGGVNGWEGVSRHSTAGRSVGRTNLEDASLSQASSRKPEMLQESSDEPETSQDVHPDDSDNSGDEEPVSPGTTEAPQKWPIIQIVAPPPWLPEGWTAVLRTRESGSKDKYYVDPVSQRRFRSKTEVNYFLQTGKSYRYKRNLALLTKPLKEDPVSLPSSVSLRNLSMDLTSSREPVRTLPFMSPAAVYGGDHRGTGLGQSRSSLSPDLRLSMLPPQAELARKPYNKPGPKPKIKTFTEDAGRSLIVSAPKRSMAEERKALESSHGQGTENRGKLILKLKRKSAELDEGQRNGKKPRPFEVVGATPVLQGKSRSNVSDEEEGHEKNPWAVDHTLENSSRVPMPHSLVPSTHVSRRPITKAPSASWQYQSHPSVLSRSQYGGSGNLAVSSNGQGHALERNSSSPTLATTESETVKGPPKRESPAEQLQKLGRKLCQQAVQVLCSEYWGRNTLQQISMGLHTSMSHGLNGGFSTHFNSVFNPAFSPAFHTPALNQQHQQPSKRMRGGVPKEKTIVPMHYTLVPHSH